MEDTKSFWKAFLWVAVPVVLLAVISTSGELYGLWFVSAAIFAGALLAMVILALFGKGKIALGVLTALVVGGIALALTCFANLSGL